MSVPETMRAVVLAGLAGLAGLDSLDSLDKLVYHEGWPTPVPGPSEVLVQVGACGPRSYNAETTATRAPRTEGGRLYVADTPGHGVEPDYDSLGEPVAVYA
jgi:hypothetical protein